MKAVCPNCAVINLTVGQQIGGRLACAAAGALFGGRVLKNPVAMLVCILVGLAIGNQIDTEVAKRCPQCGAILRIAGLFLP